MNLLPSSVSAFSPKKVIKVLVRTNRRIDFHKIQNTEQLISFTQRHSVVKFNLVPGDRPRDGK